ncbi:ribosome biogenesis protein BOP1 homolog [Macadamia integrifolia]|uniref:ribosome biogenesis protein BOP1 homolog n=1 Tax=Macadamia integrifolia TaxID=60698 RepID=UPI001C4E6D2E|nr:ribosome biogenesis protein BOP1 homolog [Macadamia integrifolia]
MALAIGEFEGHEESNEEPSEGEISEEEDGDNDEEDENEDWDDSDESEARSDDEYKVWGDSDYWGPWNNNEDDESEYTHQGIREGTQYAIQSALMIRMEGDESTSDSKDGEDIEEHEIIFEGNVDPMAEQMFDIYGNLGEMKLEVEEIDQMLGEVAINECHYTEQMEDIEEIGGDDTLAEIVDARIKCLSNAVKKL